MFGGMIRRHKKGGGDEKTCIDESAQGGCAEPEKSGHKRGLENHTVLLLLILCFLCILIGTMTPEVIRNIRYMGPGKPYMNNAEGLTYDQICTLQNKSGSRSFIWRTNYKQTLLNYLKEKELEPIMYKKSGESIVYALCLPTEYSNEKKIYQAELIRPVQNNDKGIWVVFSFREEKMPQDFGADAMICFRSGGVLLRGEKNGFGEVGEMSDAEVYFEGQIPSAATVYFTPVYPPESPNTIEDERMLKTEKKSEFLFIDDKNEENGESMFTISDIEFIKNKSGKVRFEFEYIYDENRILKLSTEEINVYVPKEFSGPRSINVVPDEK